MKMIGLIVRDKVKKNLLVKIVSVNKQRVLGSNQIENFVTYRINNSLGQAFDRLELKEFIKRFELIINQIH